jgi:hypothetical protein
MSQQICHCAFTCDDMVQHRTKDRKTGMVSVNMQQNLKQYCEKDVVAADVAK